MEKEVNFNFLLGYLSTFVGDLPRQGECQAFCEHHMICKRLQGVLAKLSKERKWNAFDTKQQHEAGTAAFGAPGPFNPCFQSVLARPGRRRRLDSTERWQATSATGAGEPKMQGGSYHSKSSAVSRSKNNEHHNIHNKFSPAGRGMRRSRP